MSRTAQLAELLRLAEELEERAKEFVRGPADSAALKFAVICESTRVMAEILADEESDSGTLPRKDDGA
jgi:hypothetical protein